MAPIDLFVESTQKRNGLDVFSPSILVGDPFTLFSRIIQIEHGCDRVHAQSISVVFFQPEQRAADQKTSHFVAAIIEDVGFPVRMEALPSVGMLKEMRAIKET